MNAGMPAPVLCNASGVKPFTDSGNSSLLQAVYMGMHAIFK